MTYYNIDEMHITKRATMWIGQTCNLRCNFCYYIDRISNNTHPEHAFMSLDKAKKICHSLRYIYNNTAVDIEGGEPTIWPHITELVKYCSEIGIAPTLITNGIALADERKCLDLKNAGLADLLISVQAIGDTYDAITGVKSAFTKQKQGINNCINHNIPFRFNCVLTKAVLPQLTEIAQYAKNSGARVVNFIAFNPFLDQENKVSTSDNFAKHEEVALALNKALDALAEAEIEANIRYFPICLLEERHRKSAYNYKQLPYDHHEWDFNSWHWTWQNPQKTRTGEPSGYHLDFEKIVYDICLKQSPTETQRSKQQIYSDYADHLAKNILGFKHLEGCTDCDVNAICDGISSAYSKCHPNTKVNPIHLGKKISDQTFYIQKQKKVCPAASKLLSFQENL